MLVLTEAAAEVLDAQLDEDGKARFTLGMQGPGGVRESPAAYRHSPGRLG